MLPSRLRPTEAFAYAFFPSGDHRGPLRIAFRTGSRTAGFFAPRRFPVRGSDTSSRFPPVAESAQPSKGVAAATPGLGNFPFLRPAATVPHRSFPPPALWMAGLRSPRLFSQEKAFFMGTGGVRSPRNGPQPNGVPKNTSPKTQLCRKGCPHVAGSLFLYFRIGLRFPSGRIRDRAAGAGFRFRNPATTGPGRLP